MIVRFKWSALKQSKWYEHVIRFGLGGLTTALTGAVAQRYGPTTGGLFLAFPAIFCASATLIEKHERERKEAKGLQGARRGPASGGAGRCRGRMGQFSARCFRPVRVVAGAGILRRITLRGRDRLANGRSIGVDVEAPIAPDWLVFRDGFGSPDSTGSLK
jgi:hypothetical protein